MAEEKKLTKRKKPSFLRRDWHKKIRIGKGIKKKQKWRAAKGRHNKIRLNERNHSKRPRVGYGENKLLKNKINGNDFIRIETLKDLETLKPGQNIIIARLGNKKRMEIIEKSKEKKLVILNKYRVVKK